MALIAAVVAGLKAYYPDLPDDAVDYIIKACLGYAAIEGLVDAVHAVAKWLAARKAESPPQQ